MTNTQGFTTLTPLALQRTCFVSEDDRLQEFAKALRVPVQIGEIIKGDDGEKGNDGNPGPAGPSGADGLAGVTPAAVSEDVEIASGVDFVLLTGDVRAKILNLFYEDLTTDPTPVIGILCLRFDGTDTRVLLSDTTVDDLYRIRITSFEV